MDEDKHEFMFFAGPLLSAKEIADQLEAKRGLSPVEEDDSSTDSESEDE